MRHAAGKLQTLRLGIGWLVAVSVDKEDQWPPGLGQEGVEVGPFPATAGAAAREPLDGEIGLLGNPANAWQPTGTGNPDIKFGTTGARWAVGTVPVRLDEDILRPAIGWREDLTSRDHGHGCDQADHEGGGAKSSGLKSVHEIHA